MMRSRPRVGAAKRRSGEAAAEHQHRCEQPHDRTGRTDRDRGASVDQERPDRAGKPADHEQRREPARADGRLEDAPGDEQRDAVDQQVDEPGMHERGEIHAVPFVGADGRRILQAAEGEQRAYARLQQAAGRLDGKAELGGEHRGEQREHCVGEPRRSAGPRRVVRWRRWRFELGGGGGRSGFERVVGAFDLIVGNLVPVEEMDGRNVTGCGAMHEKAPRNANASPVRERPQPPSPG
jgi:hypothetical protein